MSTSESNENKETKKDHTNELTSDHTNEHKKCDETTLSKKDYTAGKQLLRMGYLLPIKYFQVLKDELDRKNYTYLSEYVLCLMRSNNKEMAQYYTDFVIKSITAELGDKVNIESIVNKYSIIIKELISRKHRKDTPVVFMILVEPMMDYWIENYSSGKPRKAFDTRRRLLCHLITHMFEMNWKRTIEKFQQRFGESIHRFCERPRILIHPPFKSLVDRGERDVCEDTMYAIRAHRADLVNMERNYLRSNASFIMVLMDAKCPNDHLFDIGIIREALIKKGD